MNTPFPEEASEPTNAWPLICRQELNEDSLPESECTLQERGCECPLVSRVLQDANELTIVTIGFQLFLQEF